MGLLAFPICVMTLWMLGLGNTDRALSVSALRVGMVGPVLLVVGALFTLLAYFVRFDETLVVVFAMSALYPLSAWGIFRHARMPADSSNAVKRGATILGIVWVAVATTLMLFWLVGILTEWSQFSGRWMWRLLGGVMLLQMTSSVALHTAGRFSRRLRPLAVSFSWVLGAGVMTASPVVTVYLGLAGLGIFSHIE